MPDDLLPTDEIVPSAELQPGVAIELPVWAPAVIDVADVVPDRTRARIDGQAHGVRRVTFDDSTTPSGVTVLGFIASGVAEVESRTGVSSTRLARYGEQARETVRWYAAMLVERDRRQGQLDDTGGGLAHAQRQYLGNLTALVEQVGRLNTRLA